jgi:predicted N-acetyltransferase YhbS
MTGAPTIRPLRHGDAVVIVRIDRQRTGRSRADFYARQFETLAADPRFFVALAAEREGRVVGFAFARILDGEFGGSAPVGVLDAIGVAVEEERKGIATALLSAMEAALSARGVRELRTQADWTAHGMAAFLAAAGFQLSSRIVVERLLERPPDDELAWDELPVRSMTERDLPALIRLDRKITGHDRSAYLTRKAREVLERSAIRMSLVAEVDGQLAGFLMARVDFGEFGRTEPTSILDTIGVDPARARRGIGRALLDQLLLNLGSLRAERVVTEVDWNDLPLLAFLARTGFVHAQRLAFEKVIA